MTCEKCGGGVRSSGKCIICGYDREASNAEFKAIKEKQLQMRSIRLILFTIYQIFMCLILILISALGFSMELSTAGKVLFSLFLFFAVSRIIVSVFMLFYKKWAFYVMIGELVAFEIFQIIINPFAILTIIFDCIVNIALLYFIVSKDWHKFK